MLRYIFISILSITFSLNSGELFAQQTNTDKTPKIQQDTFEVEGVCKMCKERIENAALIKGVKFAEWDLETGNLVVAYKTSKVKLDDIHKAVAEAGHETSKYKADPKSYSDLPACCAYNDGVKKH